MERDDLILISVDDHIIEPPDMFVNHLPARYSGDAIADPLSGLTAAVRALTEPHGTLISVSMTDVVASTLAGPLDGAMDGTATAVAGQGRPPRARAPSGDAPASGADTDSVLSEL